MLVKHMPRCSRIQLSNLDKFLLNLSKSDCAYNFRSIYQESEVYLSLVPTVLVTSCLNTPLFVHNEFTLIFTQCLA